MKGKIKEILDEVYDKGYMARDTGNVSIDICNKAISQALTQILEEVEKRMLSEQEIKECILHNKAIYMNEETGEWGISSLSDLSHTLYTAQKERTER